MRSSSSDECGIKNIYWVLLLLLLLLLMLLLLLLLLLKIRG